MYPPAKQQIFKVRRRYNQWVNNQTLEDYALRFTAKGARRWSLARVANTALGAISFLALEAIGAAITINYGFENTLIAVLVVGSIIFLCGVPICYYAAKYGVDIDLLTRGAGFGYIGSTATSLIYASFTFIFFALEAAIMAKALELLTGLPLPLGYIVSSVIVLPLVFYGITFISRFQLWTQPLWIFLQVLPFIFILVKEPQVVSAWLSYPGELAREKGLGNEFNLAFFGAAAAVIFALMAQIGEQVDYLRFLPEKNKVNRARWWLAMLSAGPGWIIIGMIKILAGSLLAVLAMQHAVSASDASDPTIIYSVAFGYVVDNGQMALVIAVFFVIISQLKINVTNAYAGSIAWSNFFSRLTHSHPGRVVWLVFNVVIALVLMELGVYHAFENTLSIYAIVATSWVGALVADLVINKPTGLSPKHIEFKRAHLHDINPVGVVSTVTASFIGIIAYLGFFGDAAHALAHFIALLSAFILAPSIAVITRGQYYIARPPSLLFSSTQSIVCSVCQNHFEHEDIAFCPAYDGAICSLCCSLDSRCQDSCKSTETFSIVAARLVKKFIPFSIAQFIDSGFIKFISLLIFVSSVAGIFLALIYSTSKTDIVSVNILLSHTLWKVFFILMIIAGVISWLFVLTHESRIVAQEESNIQTQRLMQEVEAHEKTDMELQKAKEFAEAANNAKSRYLTGISHELRTPLNAILGYAQLLEKDAAIPRKRRHQISVIKRSGEHLADLIEGLLDISKIEAGKLDIHRNEIHLPMLLKQIENMFDLQAQEKGLEFEYRPLSPLPELVYGDEKRLRQILINLLSNAIKFTPHGKVSLQVRYRNQVAVFEVTDTGPGIPEKDLDRIFNPFERLNADQQIAGTGLGLTISHLLSEIMGGEIRVHNNDNGGATFTVSLMLSRIDKPREDHIISRTVYGYDGPRKQIMVVDDNESHRNLISDLLSPLGFAVTAVEDAPACLEQIKTLQPDMFLIDCLMPGMDGITLANILREQGWKQPILMISANAHDLPQSNSDGRPSYNSYLTKPVRLNFLLEKLGDFLGLNWHYEQGLCTTIETHTLRQQAPKEHQELERELAHDIITAAEIGNLSRLKTIALKMEDDPKISKEFSASFRSHLEKIRFDLIIAMVKQVT